MVVNVFLLSVPECEIKIICCWLVFVFTIDFIICAHFVRSRLATFPGGLLAKLPRRDYLISYVALSLDGVFRGCFALGSYLSHFVSFLF